MKKIFKSIFVLAVFAGGIISCMEDTLDDPKPNQITDEVIFGSVDAVNSYFSGIYRYMRRQYQYAEDTSSTDAGGLYSIYFARSVKGNDLIQAPTWYLNDYAHLNREPIYRRTKVNWQFLYDIANKANIMIAGVEKSTNLSASEKVQALGEARALRALAYFELTIDFQNTYTEDNTKVSFPIYTEPNPKESKAFSTLKEVYDFIKADLEYAVTNLSDSRLNKTHIDKQVAQGIYARVLLVTQDDWAKCEKMANAAYGGSPSSVLSPDDYSNGFDNMDDKEWMWAIYQADDQSNYYFMAPHAFMDHEADAYFGTYINSNFVSQFTATDVRNTFYNKYNSATPYRKYVSNKFAFSFSSNAPLMRTPEMILTEAEAKYWQGNEAGAKTLLDAVRINRDAAAVASTETGTALLNKILLERRKELYGEIGIEFFDLKRLRMPMKRDAVHRIVVDLDKDDKRYYLKIPQAEIDANPYIDESINANR